MKTWNPRRILNVRGERVKIRFVDGSKDADLQYGKLYGVCLLPGRARDYYLIKIDRTESEKKQQKALLHELLHLSNLVDEKSKQIPERVVLHMEEDLMEAFGTYPEIAVWVLKGTRGGR